MLKKLFYNANNEGTHVQQKSSERTKDKIGLIDTLGRMFSVRKEIRELAAEMDEKDGLSATY